MLNQTILGQLKQSNVSKNAEATKSRVQEIWKEIDKSTRDEILTFSGLNKHTVERSYKNGNISARLALALAHVLKIDPYYLTGAIEVRGEYSDEIVRQFLVEYKYEKLFKGMVEKRPYNRKNKNAADSFKNDAAETPAIEAASENYETPVTPYDALLDRIQGSVRMISSGEKLKEMPLESGEQLLKALYLRAEYSEDAKRLTDLVNIILSM